jgi:hypothetical protein
MSVIQSTQSRAGATAGTGGRRLGVALVVIAAAQLMVVLDTAIVNVALPHMQQALAESESGVAASLHNTSQQVGGSIGLAVLSTVAFTAAARAMTGARAGHAALRARPSHEALSGIYHHALATGFARGLLAAGAIMLLALLITAVTIRIRKADLAGASPL